MAPSIPFWLGEAPGRSDELSAAVSRLRLEFEENSSSVSLGNSAGEQLKSYLSLAKAALGVLPTLTFFIFTNQSVAAMFKLFG